MSSAGLGGIQTGLMVPFLPIFAQRRMLSADGIKESSKVQTRHILERQPSPNHATQLVLGCCITRDPLSQLREYDV